MRSEEEHKNVVSIYTNKANGKVDDLAKGQLFIVPAYDPHDIYMMSDLEIDVGAEGLETPITVPIAIVVLGNNPGHAAKINRSLPIRPLYTLNTGVSDENRKHPETVLEAMEFYQEYVGKQIKALRFYADEYPIG